jgi:hypothetical protein
MHWLDLSPRLALHADLSSARHQSTFDEPLELFRSLPNIHKMAASFVKSRDME